VRFGDCDSFDRPHRAPFAVAGRARRRPHRVTAVV